jgi:hypothetical protein
MSNPDRGTLSQHIILYSKGWYELQDSNVNCLRELIGKWSATDPKWIYNIHVLEACLDAFVAVIGLTSAEGVITKVGMDVQDVMRKLIQGKPWVQYLDDMKVRGTITCALIDLMVGKMAASEVTAQYPFPLPTPDSDLLPVPKGKEGGPKR